MPTKAEFIAGIQRYLAPVQEVVKQPAIQTAVAPKSALDLEAEAYSRERKERLLRLSQQLGFKSGMEALSELTGGGAVTEEIPDDFHDLIYHFPLWSRNGRVYVQSNKVDHVVTRCGGDYGAGWQDDVVFYKNVPSQPRVLDDVCKLEITNTSGEIWGSLSIDKYMLIQKPLFGVPIYSLEHFYPGTDEQLHISGMDIGQEETLRFFTQTYQYMQGLHVFLMQIHATITGVSDAKVV